MGGNDEVGIPKGGAEGVAVEVGPTWIAEGMASEAKVAVAKKAAVGGDGGAAGEGWW